MIGRYLEPFETSIRKRQSKKSKFYFFDTGVVRALQNLTDEAVIPSTFEYGDLFENFLINEFFKISESLENRWRFSYLKTKDNVEIDLIVEKPRSKPILIEIKSSNEVKASDVSSFLEISKSFPGSEKFVLSNTKRSFDVQDVHFMYWQQGLKHIFNLT